MIFFINRNRHHDLNATINHICQGMPDYDPYTSETKVIKLQRIINYIYHIESYIRSLCDEMGVTLDFKKIFLSAKTGDLNIPPLVSIWPSLSISEFFQTMFYHPCSDDSMKIKCGFHEGWTHYEVRIPLI